MPSNGEISSKFGLDRTVCCDAEIVIGNGVPFPDCPNHKNLTTEWKPMNVDPLGYEPNTLGRMGASSLHPKNKRY
jgi:hypothetical protein